MGLYGGLGQPAAAAWFHDCEFGASFATVPGEVAIESRDCRVYSYRALPSVWDLSLGRQFSAWLLTLDDPRGTMGLPNALVDAETTTKSEFLRPADEVFQSIFIDHSHSAHEIFEIENLPEGNQYRASDPYATSTDVNSNIDIGLIAGLGSGGVLCVLAALLAVWCMRARKRSSGTYSDKGPDAAPTASGIPSTLANNSHWVTEKSATFMGTICQPDAPPPDADAPASKKLEFLHTQLNGMTKDAVILERFTLLGPSQRRQAGAQPPLLVLARKAVTETNSI